MGWKSCGSSAAYVGNPTPEHPRALDLPLSDECDGDVLAASGCAFVEMWATRAEQVINLFVLTLFNFMHSCVRTRQMQQHLGDRVSGTQCSLLLSVA